MTGSARPKFKAFVNLNVFMIKNAIKPICKFNIQYLYSHN